MHGWLIYAWGFSGVLLVSALGRIVLFFVKRDAVSRFDVASGLLSLAAIPALLGFAYHRPVGSRPVWMLLCTIFLAISLYEFFTPKMRALYAKGWKPTTAVIALQCILGGPAMWAIFRYAFLDPPLWP